MNCIIISVPLTNKNHILMEAIMTQKEIYCMGRAEYLAEYEGCSLTEGYAKAEKEWEEMNK